MAKAEVETMEDILIDDAALAGAGENIELNDEDVAQVQVLKEGFLEDKSGNLMYKITMYPLTEMDNSKSVVRGIQLGEMFTPVKSSDLDTKASKKSKVMAIQALDKWQRALSALEFELPEKVDGKDVKTKCPATATWDKDLKSFVVGGQKVERDTADSLRAVARRWAFRAQAAIVNAKMALVREDEDDTDGLLNEHACWIQVKITEKDGNTYTNAGQMFTNRPKLKANFFTE